MSTANRIISLDQALQETIDNSPVLEVIEVELSNAQGHVLAEDVHSDMDMPPFNKSAMDGYALRAQDIAQAPAQLKVIEEIPAGKVPKKTIGAGQCAAIMTGAVVPDGADAVVKVEDTSKIDQAGFVTINKTVTKSKNICFQAEDIRQGQIVLNSGRKLMPQHIGILASVGKSRVKVIRKPSFAIVTTGSEIIEPDQTPKPGQIRNSNASSLMAQVAQAGYKKRYLGIVADEAGALKQTINEALNEDIVLLSGGVSMGNYDLVPAVVKELATEIIFHKIWIKPGKPLLFAKKDNRLIFGMPGNPVATLIGFETLILPVARKMAGESQCFKPTLTAELQKEMKIKTNRTWLQHAKITFRDGKFYAEATRTHGSADLLSTSESNGVIIIPADTGQPKVGQQVQIKLWDNWWELS